MSPQPPAALKQLSQNWKGKKALLSLGGDPEAAYLVSFVGDSFASSNVGDLFKEDISGYVIKPSSAFCAGTFLALKKGSLVHCL